MGDDKVFRFDNNAGFVSIEVKDDGVYLTVENFKNKDRKITFEETTRCLKLCGVQDWDFLGVSEVLAESVKKLKCTKRISENATLATVDGSVELEVFADKMLVSATLVPPVNGGAVITADMVYKALNDAFVVAGIDADAISAATDSPEYYVPFTVAQGEQPVHGKDGYLEFYFDVSKKKPVPKLLDDGNVDFHQLSLIEVVEKGKVLVRVFPPVDGMDGFNVLGKPIFANKGKHATLPKGKNVVYSEDETSLMAGISGQVVFYDKQVHVLPTLDIKGDVGPSTGDIRFLGSVFIGGSVLTGFSVIADGDVEILGSVEGAYIEAKGNLIVHGGIQGSDKAYIEVSGNLSSKFVEHSHVRVQGDFSTDYVMHSNVECGGFLEVNGKKGLLVGGRISVKEQIVANVIGSRMATQTVVHVGIKPETITLYSSLRQLLINQKKEFEALNANRLHADPQNKLLLLQIIKEMSSLRERITLTYKQLDELLPSLKNQNGTITVYTCIHPGVEITIGNRAIRVRTQIVNSILSNNGERVCIEPIGVS